MTQSPLPLALSLPSLAQGLSVEAVARLPRIRAMARAAVSRAQGPLPFYQHLVTQYDRAITNSALHSRNADLTRARDAAVANLAQPNFASIDSVLRLGDFPWQARGFEYFTARSPWNSKAAERDSPAYLVEPDPENHDKVVPFVPDGRPFVLFFSGNRQAYTGVEHEPASRFYGQDLQTLAEGYVATCARSVAAWLRVDPLPAPRLVMPVYGALASRHEQRLIHFALSQEPGFVHPSIEETALALFRALLQRRSPEGIWLARSEAELELAAPLRVVTHSYGSSALVQAIQHWKRIAPEAGISPPTLERYLSRGVCIQFGGYRLADLTQLGPTFHCVISPLDEIALGSPADSPRYTSPVALPGGVWESYSLAELRALASARFEEVPVLERAIKPGVDLWLPPMAGFEAYDDHGRPRAVLETSNGHFLSGYLACVGRRLPELRRALLGA